MGHNHHYGLSIVHNFESDPGQDRDNNNNNYNYNYNLFSLNAAL